MNRAGRRRAMALRRRRRQRRRLDAQRRAERAKGSRSEPSSSATRSGRPSTRPQDCHSATMSSLSVARTAAATKTGRRARAPRRSNSGACSASAKSRPDGDAAECRDRQIQRHAHAAHRAAQHHALAMQVDDAQALVGRFVGGGKAHGQGEGVEPHGGAHRVCAMGLSPTLAARPGSEPAGFHSTPRKTRHSRRAVAARLPQQCQSAVAMGLTTLVKRSYLLRPNGLHD